MKLNRNFLFFMFLQIIDQKVLVIDDLGITKNNIKGKKDKSKIIDLIKKKTNSENEEIVIYGKDSKNNGYKISSNNYKQENRNMPRFEKQLRENLDAFRPSSNVEIDSPIIERNKTYDEEQNKKELSYFPSNLYDKDHRIMFPDKNIFNPSFERRPTQNIPDITENFPYTPNNFSDTPNKYNDIEQRQPGVQDQLSLLERIPKQDNFSFTEAGSDLSFNSQFYNNNDSSYQNPIRGDLEHFNLENNSQEDQIEQLKNREKNNMLEAITSRKKYIDIKMEESLNKKSSLIRKIEDLKQKNEKLDQEISEIQRKSEELFGTINLKKNHIRNLIANSGDLKQKEEKTLGLIRITKNEIIRYQNILENERSKLAILEKQFNVYDQTLNTYTKNINEDQGVIFRNNNELEKVNNDLNGLKQIYSDYQKKNELLVSEIRRQEKIESDLEIEKKKININNIENVYG